MIAYDDVVRTLFQVLGRARLVGYAAWVGGWRQ